MKRLLLAVAGSSLIFTCIPLGLYVYSQHGIANGIGTSLFLGALGFGLRFYVFPNIYETNAKNLLPRAIKAGVLYVLLIFILTIVMLWIREASG